MFYTKAENEQGEITLSQLNPNVPEDVQVLDSLESFYYTIEKDKQFGGFTVFQCDPPWKRYCGKRRIGVNVKSHEEGKQAILDHLEKERELRDAIVRHGAVGVNAHTFHNPDDRYER